MKKHQARPIQPLAKVWTGLTLMELLVALVLSVLVLGMLLPLLSEVMRPSSRLDVPPEPAWSRALAADLHEIVSPDKSSLPVVRVVEPTDSDPMPQLIVETFCRASPSIDTVATRGPNEVRYRIEPGQVNGPYALVRYAQGWHDSLTSRFVVAEGLTGWTLKAEGLPTPPPKRPGTISDLRPPVSVHVELSRPGAVDAANFNVPQVEATARLVNPSDSNLKF